MKGLDQLVNLEWVFEKDIEQAERAIEGIDPKWKDAERRQAEDEIRANLAARKQELDAEHAEHLDKAVREAEIKRYQAERDTGPQTPEQWAEAQARAGFVAHDLAGLEPATMAKRCSLALEAGDQVGAWLIAREGLRILAAMEAERGAEGGIAAGLALSGPEKILKAALMGQASAGYTSDLAKIQEARATWGRLQSRAGDRRGPPLVRW